jgi:hemolysin III
VAARQRRHDIAPDVADKHDGEWVSRAAAIAKPTGAPPRDSASTTGRSADGPDLGSWSPAARIAVVSPAAASIPPRRRGERAADLGILGCGLALACPASAALIAAALARGELRLVAATGIYVAGLLAMLGASLAYHSTLGSPRRPLLRRLDHAAIFAMIAGTATPFALCRDGVLWGVGLAAAIWSAAGVGIVVKLRLPIGSVRRSAIPYLLLGWISLVAVAPSISRETALLIAAGGVFYTIGVAFFLWRRLPFHTAIWHAFVLFGAACHYFAIMAGVVFA